MKDKKKLAYGLIVISLIVISIFGYFTAKNPYIVQEDRPIKVFRLNSYQEDFAWSAWAFDAFKEVFEKGGTELEIREVNMNLHIDNSEENFALKEAEAIKIIDEWNPDIIYAQDDEAQRVIAPYVDSDIPIVFSGINYEPEKYGYDKAKNVAGVLERYDIESAVNLLKTIYSPPVEKVAVIADPFPQWATVMEQLKKSSESIDAEFEWYIVKDYNEYQSLIADLQDKADAILFLPPILFKYDDGTPVLMEDAIKQTVLLDEKIPEISFWNLWVEIGVLLSVDVSASEQGKAAGNLAKKILIDGVSPSNLEFRPTTVGEQYISLARAKTFGINKEDIPSVILVNSHVVEKFLGEEEWK